MRTSGQEVAPITATSMHQIFSFCPMDPHSSHHESADLFQPGIIQGEAQAGDPVEETHLTLNLAVFLPFSVFLFFLGDVLAYVS